MCNNHSFYLYCLTGIQFADPPAVPPVAEVKMFSNTSDMLTVYWDTPMYPNGVLQGYILTIQAVYPPDVDDEVMTFNPSVLDTSVTLFELHPGTNYTAKLWVVNDIGQSEQSFKWINTWSECELISSTKVLRQKIRIEQAFDLLLVRPSQSAVEAIL